MHRNKNEKVHKRLEQWNEKRQENKVRLEEKYAHPFQPSLAKKHSVDCFNFKALLHQSIDFE